MSEASLVLGKGSWGDEPRETREQRSGGKEGLDRLRDIWEVGRNQQKEPRRGGELRSPVPDQEARPARHAAASKENPVQG